jgi:DNA-binding protein
MNPVNHAINLEIVRCAYDPEYFIEMYLKINARSNGLIEFKLLPYQRSIIKLLVSGTQIVVNKARQIGISTIIAAYSLWRALFCKDVNIGIINIDGINSSYIMKNIQTMYDNLPFWLKHFCIMVPENKLRYKFNNGNTIQSHNSDKASVYGEYFSEVLVDELACMTHPSEVVAAYAPTTKRLQIFSSTSYNGDTFNSICRDAINGKSNRTYIKLDYKVAFDDNDLLKLSKGMSDREISMAFKCIFVERVLKKYLEKSYNFSKYF